MSVMTYLSGRTRTNLLNVVNLSTAMTEFRNRESVDPTTLAIPEVDFDLAFTAKAVLDLLPYPTLSLIRVKNMPRETWVVGVFIQE